MSFSKQPARVAPPWLIVTLTVLFTPILGGIALAVSYARLGDRANATRTAWTTVFIGGVVIGVVLLPTDPSWDVAIRGGLGGASIGLAVQWWRSWKGRYEDHLQGGGETAAAWPWLSAGALLSAAFVWLFVSAISEDIAFQEGVRHLERGENVAAQRAFEGYLADHPDDHAAQLNLGIALVQLGRYDEARDALQRVPEREEELHDTATDLIEEVEAVERFREGARALDAGDHERAEEALRRGLRRRPGNHAGRVLLARALIALGQQSEAYDELSSIPPAVPEAPEAERLRRQVASYRGSSTSVVR